MFRIPLGGSMQRDDYTEANRRSWNETAPVHAARKFQGLLEGFRTPGYLTLDALETERLTALGLAGKSVAQLACNNGRELLSIKGLGAGRCVGFDISDEFMAQGGALAAAGGLDCQFVRVSVYDIPHEYDAGFDLVYISIGALGWMPDLDAFFAVAARLLRPGGHLFVYEMHPLLDMFEEIDEGAAAADPLKIHYSYFKDDPYVDTSGLDYYGGTTYEGQPTYWFHHKLSDILGGLLHNGISIEAFDEYPHDISNVFAHLEPFGLLPLSYILVGRKG